MDIFTSVGVQNFALFVSSALIFTLTPGIDTMLVLNQSLAHGKKLATMTALGVATGVLVHTLLAGLGLATIVAQSALPFYVIKYLGALYLFYLGIKTIYQAKCASINIPNHQFANKPTLAKAYRTGLFTNVLNPKVALFFVAFFPQFIVPSTIGSPTPYLLLGAIYALMAMIWLVLLALLTGLLFAKLFTHAKSRRMMDIGCGLVFMGMGIKVALSD